ncbi:MAG: Crp/Fnr family transcriptional regulator [Gammaproteobacteria bacterium]|nr:Crp/Fnr family transcriptional regulator [Gammaproteobacteria bacterium]
MNAKMHRLVTDRRRTALHARLQLLEMLLPEERDELDAMLQRTRRYEPGEPLQFEQSRYEVTRVVLSGWATRSITLENGQRQITNFVLPGETIGLYGGLFNRCNHAIEALTDLVAAEMPCTSLFDIVSRSSRLGAVLFWIGGQDERLMEEQVLRLGRMSAIVRIAHLLVELHARLRMSGIQERRARVLPISQALLAETLGMSHVHANRCCRKLQDRGWIESNDGHVTLLEVGELAEFCHYDPSYLAGGNLPQKTRQRLKLGRAAA